MKEYYDRVAIFILESINPTPIVWDKVRYSWRLTDEQARILIPGSRSSVGGEARVGGLNKNR